MEEYRLEVGCTISVYIEQKDEAVLVVSYNYKGITYRGVLIKGSNTNGENYNGRNRTPVLPKRPKPFHHGLHPDLLPNKIVADNGRTESMKDQTESMKDVGKYEKNDVTIEENINGSARTALSVVPDVLDIENVSKCSQDKSKEEELNHVDSMVFVSNRKEDYQHHRNFDETSDKSEISGIDSNSSCKGIPVVKKTILDHGTEIDKGNGNNESSHDVYHHGTSGRRRMATTNKFCHACNEFHNQKNGLSKKRRRGPKTSSTYYLTSRKKSIATSNNSSANGKSPGHTIGDVCNKLHAVANSKRKSDSTDSIFDTEKKVKGAKIVNGDNSKTVVKYDPNCRTFGVGDIVWGKIQGYPWWPGRIVSLDATTEEQHLYPCKAVVAWYNSRTCSIISARQLYDFTKWYDERHMPKRRGGYRKAVDDAVLAAQQRQSYNVVAS